MPNIVSYQLWEESSEYLSQELSKEIRSNSGCFCTYFNFSLFPGSLDILPQETPTMWKSVPKSNGRFFQFYSKCHLRYTKCLGQKNRFSLLKTHFACNWQNLSHCHSLLIEMMSFFSTVRYAKMWIYFNSKSYSLIDLFILKRDLFLGVRSGPGQILYNWYNWHHANW